MSDTSEETAPYGSGSSPATSGTGKVRTHHLQQWKDAAQPWPMLTAYDQYAAEVFDEAGIPVLLVGDSASNNVFANDTSLPVTVDQLLGLTQAVTRSANRALVVSDLPFGTYEASPQQAFSTAARFLKDAGAHAVKLEGGLPMVPQTELLVDGGIPVMSHIGFTPQSEHTLGGYRVQGRGEQAEQLIREATALQDAGAFALVMEMVPAPVAREVTNALRIPTIGIGAGAGCDAQVLVWQDMMGLRTGKAPRFVKRYADLHSVMLQAAQEFAGDVTSGRFPAEEHSFDE